jgi:hypothetical protein
MTGNIMITPIGSWGKMTQFYMGEYTPTEFTIYAEVDPEQDIHLACMARQ